MFFCLLFLLWCNFLPPLAAFALGSRFDAAIDGGRHLPDGEPLFGPHKTARGVLAALLGSFVFIPFLATRSWLDVPMAALLACLGDLISSFSNAGSILKAVMKARSWIRHLKGCFPLPIS